MFFNVTRNSRAWIITTVEACLDLIQHSPDSTLKISLGLEHLVVPLITG
jgi:hypothetical protein